jgi:cell division control protein 7
VSVDIVGSEELVRIDFMDICNTDRTFATNVPSVTQEGMTWREFVEKQNPDLFKNVSSSPSSQSNTDDNDTNATFSSPSSSPAASATTPQDLENVLDFLSKCLHHESTARITARDALYHPFLAEGQDPALADDLHCPHPIGQGKCGALHWLDEVTEEHCISVMIPGEDGKGGREEVRKVAEPGRGIAYGERMCEFHEGMEEYVREATQRMAVEQEGQQP